jgi:membrane-bound lytic murein transglycosylase B
MLIFSLVSTAPAAEPIDYFGSLQQQLIADGLEETMIRALYARPEVKFETLGISVYFVHRESKVDYDQYSDPRQIRRAKQYMQSHRDAFSAAEIKFGVHKEVIAAIILIETQLGKLLGSRSILNTLSTMAALSDPTVQDLLWDQLKDTPELTREVFEEKIGQKSAWAYRELKAYLLHAQTEGFDPTRVSGSFAGAMGIAQFMPSNIGPLARDGNDDGRINLFDDADAIASVASYLKQHGWQPGIDRQQAAKVIYHYNHSDRYVQAVLKVSDLLKG